MANFFSNTFLNLIETNLGGFAGMSAEAALHTAYPNNFEFYLIALEVRDEDKNNIGRPTIKRSLIFPTLPERILDIEKKISKVTKTSRGIIVNDIDTFVPIPLNISGTFGKRLRLLYGSKINDDDNNIVGASLSNIKTGYGTLKLLQEIFNLSKSTNDFGIPYRTVFYNLAFSSAFVVHLEEFKPSQSVDKNKLWMYDMQMTLVSPLEDDILEQQRIQELLRVEVIGNTINKTLSDVNIAVNSMLSIFNGESNPLLT